MNCILRGDAMKNTKKPSENIKHKHSHLYGVFAVTAAVLTLLFSGCAIKAPEPLPIPPADREERLPVIASEKTNFVTVYFADTDYKFLLPVSYEISPTMEYAKTALEMLLTGVPNNFAAALLPEKTSLRFLYTTGNAKIIYADFSENISSLSPERAALAIQSIVCTVLANNLDYTLQIMVNGDIVPSIGGVNVSEPLGFTPPNADPTQNIDNMVTIYMADTMVYYLIPIAVYTDGILTPQKKAEFAIKTMLAFSEQNDMGLVPTLWAKTALNNLEVKNSIAYVDFSSALLGYGGGSTAEYMMLNSLLYTLCSISGIEGMQMLIDGEKINYMPEGSLVNTVLRADIPVNITVRE